MSQQETISRIRDFICQDAKIETTSVESDTNLFEGGILDSLRILSLVLFIESNFGISLQYEDLTEENFSSVGRLTQLIAEKNGEVA